jgi:hypothetical protein
MTQLQTAIIDTGAGFRHKKVPADYNLDCDPDYLDALNRGVRVQRPYFDGEAGRGFPDMGEISQLLKEAKIEPIKREPYRGYTLKEENGATTITVKGDGAGIAAWISMLVFASIVIPVAFLVNTGAGVLFLLVFGIAAAVYLSKSNQQALTIGGCYFSNGISRHNISDIRAISIVHKDREVATAAPSTNSTGAIFAFTGVGGVAFGAAMGAANALNQTGQALGNVAQTSINKRSYGISYRYGAGTVTAFTNLALPKAESILEKIVELANKSA